MTPPRLLLTTYSPSVSSPPSLTPLSSPSLPSAGGFARKTVRVFTGYNPTDDSPKPKGRATPPAAARRLLLGSPRANAEGARTDLTDRWDSPREMPAGVPHVSQLLS